MKNSISSVFQISIFFLIMSLWIQQDLQAQTKTVSNNLIFESEDTKGWVIQLKSVSYQIVVNKEGEVRQVYFGPNTDKNSSVQKSAWINSGPNEIPVRGGFPNKTPLLEVVFPDNVRDTELRFVKGDIVEKQGRMTLRIVQKDTHYPLEIISFIRVLPEYDLMEKWVQVNHTGDGEAIKIENLKSASSCLTTFTN